MKFALIFLILCINLYGNLLTTNGKISLSLNQNEMRIQNIKGSVFEEPVISILDMGVLINNTPYILNKSEVSSKMIPNTNIILVNSRVEGVELATFIIPSALDRNKLYIATYIKEGQGVESLKLIYRIHPYKNINILDYSSPKDYYSLDDFRMKSLNNPMGMYTSNEEYMEGFKFREVRDRLIRYQDEKLLLASEITGTGRWVSDILVFDYGKEKWENKVVHRSPVLKDEYNYWKEWNWEFQNLPPEVREQLTQLKMITMGTPMPKSVSHSASEKELVTSLKLSTLLANYNKPDEALKILKGYRLGRKNSSEDVAILVSLVKSWEHSREIVDSRYIKTYIYPVFQRVLAGIDENGRFNIENDNIETYFYLISIFKDLLKDESETSYIPKEKIEEKLILLEKNVRENYMTPDGIKNTPRSLEVNPRNVEFLDLYPKEVRIEILMEEYNKYYSKRLGFLIFPGENYLDTDYNLTFARYLYDNGLTKEGEMIFARVRELVERNNNYVTPKMYHLEKNESGIYGDLIFSYLITNYFRGIEQ